jgi:uncharacterized membrane protein YgcG
VTWPELDPNPEATEAALRAKIVNDMQAAATWATANNRPLYLGEFGVSSLPDDEARADWTASVIREAEARGMSWAHWQFTSDMGIWDATKMEFIPVMLEALKGNYESDTSGSGGSGGSGGAGEAGGADNAGGSGGTSSGAPAIGGATAVGSQGGTAG